jgi:hypothetical protein
MQEKINQIKNILSPSFKEKIIFDETKNISEQFEEIFKILIEEHENIQNEIKEKEYDIQENLLLYNSSNRELNLLKNNISINEKIQNIINDSDNAINENENKLFNKVPAKKKLSVFIPQKIQDNQFLNIFSNLVFTKRKFDEFIPLNNNNNIRIKKNFKNEENKEIKFIDNEENNQINRLVQNKSKKYKSKINNKTFILSNIKNSHNIYLKYSRTTYKNQSNNKNLNKINYFTLSSSK